MAAKNAFYAQSGGVTAVINASAAGVIETARQQKGKIGKIYAGRNGIIGALTEDLIDTGKDSIAAIRALRHTPSGAFGSCRYKLKSLEENRREATCLGITRSESQRPTLDKGKWYETRRSYYPSRAHYLAKLPKAAKPAISDSIY